MTIRLSSSKKKPRGIFLNSEKANCSIHESGQMAYQCLLLSDKYNLDYLEISQKSHNIGDYDFYVFNYHHVTMSWLNTKSICQLPGVKITLVLETLTNNPFVLCPADDFDAYCVLDPTMNVTDKRVYAFPRPLEVPEQIIPYTNPDIPIIGSFGFATPGKGFELVIDAVNKEFEEAIVRINIPSATYADEVFWKLHKRNYAKYLGELCQKVAKKGIKVVITHDYMSKQELIKWCGQNTLNCFLYNRNQPGLSATTDQAISSGRPLAISSNETFRHIHSYIKPYPFQSLQQSIASSQSQIIQMQKDWTPKNFALKFETVLTDLGVLPRQHSFQVNESPKSKVLIVSHKQKQCGIYQYGFNIAQALQKSSRYSFIYKECSDYQELRHVINTTNPDVVIYNYYPATMPWLNSDITRQYNFPQLGIMHEVTQEDADKATQEMFDYHLCPDPTLQENNPLTFRTKRLIPSYINMKNIPDVITIGSFGFGDKGFERLVTMVQQEFEQAHIRLHLPFNDIVDQEGKYHAIATANRCKNIVTKPGITLSINHDFMSKEQLLDFLASSTINAFLDDTHKHQGISSCIEHALAVQRPIAITKCGIFRHVLSASPSICIEDSTLKQIIDNGIAPLVPFYNEWSEANFILDYERILDEMLLNKNNNPSNNQQISFKRFNMINHEKNLCKILKSRSEVYESTQYLQKRGYVSHRLGCKDWDLANIIDDLSDGNLLDMGSSDSYLLKNALIKNLQGYKYGIDLQEPDVPLDEVKYIVGDLIDTGLPDNFFQNITCLSVLEHEVDIKRFAKEVSRILAQQGRLYITVDYWNPKVIPQIKIFDKQWNIFDRNELINLIQECKEKNLHLVNEMDWSLGEAVINPYYHSPDLIHYTFAMLVFQKDILSKEISQKKTYETLLLTNLGEINLIICPNWSAPEDLLLSELEEVINALITHPNQSSLTLFIEASNILEDDANLIISAVIMNVLMSKDLDTNALPEISLVDSMALENWDSLLSNLNGRIILNYENQEIVSQLKLNSLSTIDINNINDLKSVL